MRIKYTATTLIILLSLATIFGCAFSKKEETVSVALFQAPASQALIELIPEFEKTSHIKVNYEILPYADLKAKVEQQFFSKNGNYDVIMADCTSIPSFAVRGYLGEVDTSVWPAGTYDFDDLFPSSDDYLGGCQTFKYCISGDSHCSFCSSDFFIYYFCAVSPS